MIHHVVMLRFKDATPEGHRDELAAALGELPGLIPQIVQYAFGPDLGLANGNHDFAVAAQFATREDYLAYNDHPEHRRVVGTFIVPYLSERVAVQFEAR